MAKAASKVAGLQAAQTAVTRARGVLTKATAKLRKLRAAQKKKQKLVTLENRVRALKKKR